MVWNPARRPTIMKTLFAHWKGACVTGLAVVLPAAMAIGAVVWLFGLVAHFRDALLVPSVWTRAADGTGPRPVYWSVMAFAMATLWVGLVGSRARRYPGKKLIGLVDPVLMRLL